MLITSNSQGFIFVIRSNGERDGVIAPGTNLTGREQEIADYATEVWTSEILSAYAASQVEP